MNSAAALPAERHAAGGGSDPDTGDTILGATVLVKIGSGNVGTVWTALDGDGVVAIKLFDPSIGGEAGRAAFARGVQGMETLAALDEARRPSILRLIRASPDRLQMVTELMEHNAEDIPVLGWTPPEIVKFFEGVCRAIDAAHQVGIVHGALKPSNVLVNDDLEPLVGDFGMVDLPSLARRVNDGGHAPYAAPEALSGKGGATPASDIYSLGRLLWFLLLGAEPDEPAAYLPVLRALRRQPPGLVRILRKCTMKQPEARYQRVGELLADLARFESADEVGVAGADVDAEPISARESRPPSVRRSQIVVRPSLRLSSLSVSQGLQKSRSPLPATLPPPEDRWLARGTELVLAASGAVLVLVAGAAIAFSRVPSEQVLRAAQIGAAVGASLLTLAAPRFPRRLALTRVALAISAAALVFLVGVSPLAMIRLRATASSADAGSRSAAVRRLVRGGRRDFGGANLAGLDLTGADLSSASFRGAVLTGTDVSHAALMESAFDGADLTGVRALGANLVLSNADAARGWETLECDPRTRLPAGWSCIQGHPGRPDAAP